MPRITPLIRHHWNIVYEFIPHQTLFKCVIRIDVIDNFKWQIGRHVPLEYSSYLRNKKIVERLKCSISGIFEKMGKCGNPVFRTLVSKKKFEHQRFPSTSHRVRLYSYYRTTDNRDRPMVKRLLLYLLCIIAFTSNEWLFIKRAPRQLLQLYPSNSTKENEQILVNRNSHTYQPLFTHQEETFGPRPKLQRKTIFQRFVTDQNGTILQDGIQFGIITV